MAEARTWRGASALRLCDCTRVIARVLVLSLAGAACVQSSAPDERVLSCDTFPPDLSAADLRERFGAGNVSDADIHVGEGQTERGTVLFGSSPEDRIELLWKDSDRRRAPRAIYVREATSRWHSPAGLKVGIDLKTAERLNGQPFRLLGFGWDYSGTVMTWSGGRLDAAPSASCRVRARLSPEREQDDASWRTWYGQVTGDREFSSGHPAMQALNPVVYELWVDYARADQP